MAHTILSLARKVADTLVDELGDVDLKRDHEAAKDLLTDRLVSIFTAEALRRATTKLEG